MCPCEFLAGPARDLLLSLVVPAPPQQRCRSHPEDSLRAFHRRESDLKEAGQQIPSDTVWFVFLFPLLLLEKVREAGLKVHHHPESLDTAEPKYEKVRLGKSGTQNLPGQG